MKHSLINRAKRLPARPPLPPADDVEGRIKAKVAGMTSGQRHDRRRELHEKFCRAERIDPADHIGALRRHVERCLARGDTARANRWAALLHREEQTTRSGQESATPANGAGDQTGRRTP